MINLLISNHGNYGVSLCFRVVQRIMKKLLLLQRKLGKSGQRYVYKTLCTDKHWLTGNKLNKYF